MAVQITKLFSPTTLTTGNTTLYTASAQPATLIVGNVRFRFANATITPAAVTAYAVPSGGSPGVGNIVLNGEAIAGNSHMDVDMPVLAPGDFYVAVSGTANAIVVSELAAVVFS